MTNKIHEKNNDEPVTSAHVLCLAARRSCAAVGRMRLVLVGLVCAFLVASGAPLAFGLDDHNPIGVTGAFEGVITTAGAYNVLNHSATRQIEDLVVPGAVGKYGLKLTRYYNSRGNFGTFGPGWTHGYEWSTSTYDDVIYYPNGSVQDSTCTSEWGVAGPLGVSDGWEDHPSYGNGTFRLADGGKVVFENHVPHFIIDPYGQTLTLTYGANLRVSRVTEPGGRYLQFTYGTSQLQVDAYDGQGNPGNLIDSVVYHYSAINPGSGHPSVQCVTSVDYSDSTNDYSTHAHYTYQEDNAPEHPPPCPCSYRNFPVVIGCDDVRYSGAMRRIAYVYQNGGPHGAILQERYWDGTPGDEGIGPLVSRIDPPAPSPLVPDPNFDTTYTEYRGDGPVRTFNYTELHINRLHNGEPQTCPDIILGPAPQQFLLNYTDFRNHMTYLGYDSNRYVNSVRDSNDHTTTYLRGPPPDAYPGPPGTGQILKITHHDQTHIDYTYEDESPNISGHYVHSVSNERQKVTTYTRDPTTHLVTRIDYPQDANTPASFEVFTYNGFGQVLTHQLRNGAWESFVYDINNRGLLTDKYNPKQTGVPTGSDPHTHYTYYTSGPWTDRVMTMTLPGNFPNSLQASETYEYDRTLGADGTTDPFGAAVAGRGLVTKITHGDNTYQSFGYDKYGNKRWEENELRQRNSYTYDEYNRLLTATNPLNKTTTYTYNPTNGGGGSPYLHTTNSPDTITTPTGIVTKNIYDQNFRKTSSTAAYGTLNLTTAFDYDPVGNLTYITDPLTHQTYNTYDSRNRKITTTEAYGTNLARTTTWNYEDGINVTRIDRPDSTSEWKTYDALNRMTAQTVRQTSSIYLNTYIAYNPSGTIASVTDANNHTTSFTYDASDQKTLMTYDGGTSTQQWYYDDAHNLKYRITVNNETQVFFYDIRNHKYATWWSNWDNNIVDWRYFGYDAAGQLTEAENGTGGWNKNIISDIHRTYDAAGHLTLDQQTVTGLGTENVNYPTYDDDGRLTRMYASGVSGGYDFTYSYDAAGRFEKLFITNSLQLFQYYYDPASNEIERHNVYLNPAVNQVYPRDALNRMQYVDVTRSNNTLAHEGYTYDPMNRITLVDYGNGHTDSFGYYLDGELNQAQLGNFNRNVTYTLDRAGNRTSVVDTGVTTSYTPNNINEYSAISASAITNGPEHEIQSLNGVLYTYMNDERLSSAATTSGLSIGNSMYQLVYDALGRCVKRSLNGLVTYYVYDGEKPILEYDAGGASVGVNVYGKGIDEILERVAIGSDNQWHIYFFQQNHEGSVTLLTDTAGNVIESYRYDVFGAPTIYDGNWNARSSTIYDNRFLFTGREYAATYRSTYNTPAFNFYEYRARAYNAQLGRFMSEDPKLFDAGDYNLFRYCHNDPIDFTDPMGLESHREPWPNHQEQAIAIDIEEIRREVTGSHIPQTVGYEVTVTSLNMGPPGGQFKDAAWGKSTNPHAPMLVKGASEQHGTHTFFNVGVRDKQTNKPVRDIVYTKETIKFLAPKNAEIMAVIASRGYTVGYKGWFQDDVGMDPWRKGPLGNAMVPRLQDYEIAYGDKRWWFPNAFKQISTGAPGGSVRNELIPLAVDHPSDDHP